MPFKGQSLSIVGDEFRVMLLQCPDFIPEYHGDVLEGVSVGQVAHGKGVSITVRRKRLDRFFVEASGIREIFFIKGTTILLRGLRIGLSHLVSRF